jgi:acyl carrier protein
MMEGGGMSHPNDIAEKLKRILAEELKVGVEELKPEKRIVEDFGADSLQRVEIVMKIEEAFGIKIPDDEAMGLVTVQDTIDYVLAACERKVSG